MNRHPATCFLSRRSFSLAVKVCRLVAGASRPRAPKALKTCPFRTSEPRRPRYFPASQHTAIREVPGRPSRRVNRTVSGRTLNPFGNCNIVETCGKLAKNAHSTLGNVYKHPQNRSSRSGRPPVNPHTTTSRSGRPPVNSHTTTSRSGRPSVNPHTTSSRSGRPPVNPHTTSSRSGRPPVNPHTVSSRSGRPPVSLQLPSNKQNKP